MGHDGRNWQGPDQRSDEELIVLAIRQFGTGRSVTISKLQRALGLGFHRASMIQQVLLYRTLH
ncbi:MAG: hypothetical protein JSS36_06980 [Proteobacteria bacterium]|nr:hypothetical protein [Pseudomonadota bacterium]